ncbi:MAG: N-acetylmuramoyl-L-alanine amidase [bacterium]
MKKIFKILVVSAFLLFPALLFGSLSGKKICVDPGHGGSDPGATGWNGSTPPNEADFVLDIDLRLQYILKSDDATVVMTRDDDVEISLENRVEIANNNNVDIFVSTHLNSFTDPSANGTETYAYPTSTNGKTLRDKIQNKLLHYLKRKDRGVKTADFYVLKKTSMPAAISEGLFVSNETEFNLISQSPTRQDHAIALYEAVCDYFGVTPKDIGSETPGEKVGVIGFAYNASKGGNVEGNRIAGADCVLKKAGSSDINTVTNSAGLFNFQNIDAGEYTLEITKAGFNKGVRDVAAFSGEIWASTPLTEDDGTEISQIKGFVFNESTGLGNVEGNRIAAATLKLKRVSDGEEMSVVTNDDGLFVFNDLNAEGYTLTASKAGFTTVSKSLDLNAGENWSSIGIEEANVAQLGGLKGTVTSKTSGEPIQSQCILTSKTSGESLIEHSDESGKYEFNGIIPDDYTLAVNAEGFLAWSGDVTIMSDQMAVKNVELTPVEDEQVDDFVPDIEEEDELDTDINENEVEDKNEKKDDENIPANDNAESEDELEDSDWSDFGEVKGGGGGCSSLVI